MKVSIITIVTQVSDIGLNVFYVQKHKKWQIRRSDLRRISRGRYFNMKLILPDGTKKYINPKQPVDIKIKIVEDVLAQYGKYFQDNWDTKKTRVCLDILCSFLVTGNDVGNNDKEVLSKYKEKCMERGHKCIPFSDLTKAQQTMLGLVDVPDDEE